MRRLLTAAAALALLTGPAVSLAQEHREEGGHPPEAPHAAPPAHAPSGPPGGGNHGPPAGGVRPPAGGAQGVYRPQVAGAPAGDYRPGAPGAPYPGFHGPAGVAGARVPVPPPGARGPRPGAQPFAVGGRTFYRYRAAPYVFPPAYRGWEHHGWRRGEFLPAFFFSPSYFISDWWAYGLWAPDYGYQWIRVGADALLINLATGEVVDVAPGIYYW
jgi:Ni/Co efflux regulator RcnB